MNEQDNLLSATVEKLFGDIAADGLSKNDAARLEEGALPAEAAQLVEDNGITAVLLPEEAGGFNGSWQDAALVASAAGYHALPLPIVDTLLAQYVLHRAQLEVPAGAIALGVSDALQIEGGKVNGAIDGVAWAGAADHVLLVSGHSVALVAGAALAGLNRRRNIPGEPVADLELRDVPAIGYGVVADDVFALRALLCVAQMAGALSAALAQSVAYANERQQFGRPIGKFQAIQQNLAVFAGEVAAINCAARAASRAADLGDARFEIAAAKLRANRAVGVATSIAHQVHGGIGFTREHSLHRLTQRLWQWRSDYGNDRFWARELGAGVAQRGADNFWSDLTMRGDRR
jgi:acyl-CoA dehydrogenase